MPDTVRFRADIYIYKTNSEHPEVDDWEQIDSFRVTIQEPSERGILYIISEFMLLIKNHVDATLKDEAIIFDWCYSYRTQELNIAIFSEDDLTGRKYGMKFEVDTLFESESQCGFIELLSMRLKHVGSRSIFWNWECVVIKVEVMKRVI